MQANPFFFESPSDRWSFTDRELLLPPLVEFLGQRGRRLLLHGRRRMGKTSLIHHAAAKARAKLIYVDVSAAASFTHLAKKLLEAAPAEQKGTIMRVIELAKKHFKSFALTAGKVALTGDLREEKGETTLEQVLLFLNERAILADEAWTICFDEFQDLRKLGGERVDWQLRGIIQEHRAVNYVFTGSHHRLMQWMSEYDSAFFKQLQQIEVGPIDPDHLAKWIDARAKTGGLPDAKFGARVVEVAGPCTGDVVRLAKVAFDMVSKRGSADPVATALDAIALVELNSEFSEKWRGLALGQRSILQVVIAGKPTTSAETLKEFGIRTASTAQTAVERLIERDILVRDDNGVVFDNPFFKRWVMFNAA